MFPTVTKNEESVVQRIFSHSRFLVVDRCENDQTWLPPQNTVKKTSNYFAIRNHFTPFLVSHNNYAETAEEGEEGEEQQEKKEDPGAVEFVVDDKRVLLVNSDIPAMVEMAENLLLEAQACDPLDPKDYAKRFTRWINSTFSLSKVQDVIASYSPDRCESKCNVTADKEAFETANIRHSPPIHCNGAKVFVGKTLEGSVFEWWSLATEYWDLGVCDSFEKSLNLSARHLRTQNFVPRLFGFSTDDNEENDANDDNGDNDEQQWVEWNGIEPFIEEDFLLFAVEEDWLAAHSYHAPTSDIQLTQTVFESDEMTQLMMNVVDDDCCDAQFKRRNSSCFAHSLYPVQTYQRPVC